MDRFRPMLAGTLASASAATLPVLCTPKLDGIRCVLRDGEPLTRRLKPIPNRHVSGLLRTLPDGLDGELVTRGGFNATQSAIMSEDGAPDFRFAVFDIVREGPYSERMAVLEALPLPRFCRKILPTRCATLGELDAYEAAAVAGGFEGVMLRSASGPYKFGRSTLREGWLLKLKRFEDGEAVVVGFEEMLRNENAAVTNALGLTERSSHKSNLVPAGVLGVLRVRDLATGAEFGVSTGLTTAQRGELWARRASLVGRVVKYKHQAHGAKDAPRIPVFLGFRSPLDMDEECSTSSEEK